MDEVSDVTQEPLTKYWLKSKCVFNCKILKNKKKVIFFDLNCFFI